MFFESSVIFKKIQENENRHSGLSFLISWIFQQNVRLGILKLVKPDICLKTDNINYVPLNPFFMFCWIEFWDMFFGVYLVPPRRPCLAAIMSNHHQFPISPAPPPTPPNQPSATWLKRVGEKNIKLFNVLNSLISSSDNHHEKKISH